MDLFEAIETRRSIRKYTQEAVSGEDALALLKAAMQAPSARNQQPWQFVTIRDAAMREIISKASPYTGMARESPLVIIVCGDLSLASAPDFWPQDCAAAVENLLLAARGKNLGAVWCGIYPAQERVDYLKKALSLPENIIPFALVCVGHTDLKFHNIDRFKPERVHDGKWGNNGGAAS